MAAFTLGVPANRWSRDLRINWRHPLSKSLYSCVVAGHAQSPLRDLVDGAGWAVKSGSLYVTRQRNRGPICVKSGFDFNLSHTRGRCPVWGTSASGFMVVFDVGVNAGLLGDNRATVNNGLRTNNSSQLQLRVSSSDMFSSWGGTVPTSGECRIGYSTQSTLHTCYIDGALHAGGSDVLESFKGVNEIGGYTGNPGQGIMSWQLMYSWNDRFLSAAEHLLLARDPYCLLETPVLYFTSAAAATFNASWARGANTVISPGGRVV